MRGDQQVAATPHAAPYPMVPHHPMLRVDHGIAGDEDALRRNRLFAQRQRRALGRREMETGNATDHLAQAFLGEWPFQIVGAQARLDVRDGNAMMEAA